MSITIEHALKIAKKIQRRRPQLILGGSLGMILHEAMAERKVNDLDFACHESQFAEGEFSLETSYGKNHTSYEGYKTYKVSIDDGFYYNVFSHEKPFDFVIINEIKVQLLKDIVKYKLEWQRPKDRADLADPFMPMF